MFDGFTKEDFQKAVAANPEAWAFGAKAAAAQPTAFEQFQSGVQSINEGYQQQLGKIASSGQYDRQSQILDAGSHLRVKASNEVEALMNELGLTQKDLKQSVKGSSNDLFMDLGVGNIALHDVKDIDQSTTVSLPNVRDVAAQGGPVKTTSDQLGDYTIAEHVETSPLDNQLLEIGAGLLAPMTLGGSVVALKAAQAATGKTLKRGDYAQAALAAASPHMQDVIGKAGTFGDMYNAPNVGGAFVQGSTNDLISQAVINGDISLEDAAKAGLLSSGMAVGRDVLGDAQQTNTGNQQVGRDTLDGVDMTQADIDRLQNTSDLYGILGEDGLLSKVGLNPGESFLTNENGYLKTGYVGDALDLIGMGGRPVIDPDGKITEKYREEMQGISEDPALDYYQKLDAIQNVEDAYFKATQRYDERFFDMFAERGDSPLVGIHELNRRKSTTPSIPSTGTGGSEGTRPTTASVEKLYGNDDIFTDLNDPEYKAYMEQNLTAEIDTNDTKIVDDIFQDLLPATGDDTDLMEGDTFDRSTLDDGRLRLGPGDREGGYVADDGSIYVQPEAEQEIEQEIDWNQIFNNIEGGEPKPAGGGDDPFPQGGGEYPDPQTEIETEPEPEVTEDEEFPPGGGTPSGGGSEREPSDRRRKEAEEDDELFRLAKIVQVEGIPEDVREAVMGRIKGIIAGRGQRGSVAGDVTAARDRKSTTRVSREDIDKRPRRTVEDIEDDDDEIQKAIDEAGK